MEALRRKQGGLRRPAFGGVKNGLPSTSGSVSIVYRIIFAQFNFCLISCFQPIMRSYITGSKQNILSQKIELYAKSQMFCCVSA